MSHLNMKFIIYYIRHSYCLSDFTIMLHGLKSSFKKSFQFVDQTFIENRLSTAFGIYIEPRFDTFSAFSLGSLEVFDRFH